MWCEDRAGSQGCVPSYVRNTVRPPTSSRPHIPHKEQRFPLSQEGMVTQATLLALPAGRGNSHIISITIISPEFSVCPLR